eukprot:362279-Chlamydomonas_euryale.AAC.5
MLTPPSPSPSPPPPHTTTTSQVVLAVDRPCQLLGVGLCGTEGSLTVELEVYQVDPEDFSNELATLCTCAQSFTKVWGAGRCLREGGAGRIPQPVEGR